VAKWMVRSIYLRDEVMLSGEVDSEVSFPFQRDEVDDDFHLPEL
jgi:hypothetical protein